MVRVVGPGTRGGRVLHISMIVDSHRCSALILPSLVELWILFQGLPAEPSCYSSFYNRAIHETCLLQSIRFDRTGKNHRPQRRTLLQPNTPIGHGKCFWEEWDDRKATKLDRTLRAPCIHKIATKSAGEVYIEQMNVIKLQTEE